MGSFDSLIWEKYQNCRSFSELETVTGSRPKEILSVANHGLAIWAERKPSIRLANYSRFSPVVMKTKNRNHAINKFKNLGYNRWLLYKRPRQESGICCFSFARYSK